jgi:sugar phosphate permease
MLGSVIAALAMGVSSFTAAFGVFFSFRAVSITGWARCRRVWAASFHDATWRYRALRSNRRGGLIASFSRVRGSWFGWRYAFHSGADALGIWAVLFLQRDRPEEVGLPSVEVYHPRNPTPLADEASPCRRDHGR